MEDKSILIESVVKYLRSGIYFNYANEYANALEDGSWVNDLRDLMIYEN